MSQDLEKRMKRYELTTKHKLIPRCPILLRIDGRSFSNYTKYLDRPFDEGFINDMKDVCKYLGKEIAGCKLIYAQSDEINILITDYDTLATQPWFDNTVQKICSITASLTTSKFNQLRLNRFISSKINSNIAYDSFLDDYWDDTNNELKNVPPLAHFDTRVFQIADPEEVINYFVWRQRDWMRNSVTMLARSLYSHNEIDKKNQSEMKQMCIDEVKIGINSVIH